MASSGAGRCSSSDQLVCVRVCVWLLHSCADNFVDRLFQRSLLDWCSGVLRGVLVVWLVAEQTGSKQMARHSFVFLRTLSDLLRLGSTLIIPFTSSSSARQKQSLVA
jgi:hypothetical protein